VGFSGLSLKACEYRVRGFEDGDEVEIVRLFDRVYAGYGGFTLKTPEYWRWCCLNASALIIHDICLHV